MGKKLSLFISIGSVILLGAVILFRPSPEVGDIPPPHRTPREQLELFMNDNMDYGVRLSRVLAERRIARAMRFADQYPELETRAQEVIDSLRARLQREAVID